MLAHLPVKIKKYKFTHWGILMWEPVEVDTLVVFFLFNVEITT